MPPNILMKRSMYLVGTPSLVLWMKICIHGGTEVQHRPQAVPPQQNPALYPALPKLSHPHPQRLRSSDGTPVEHEFARRKRFGMGWMGDHFRRHGHGNFLVHTIFNIYGTKRS